MMNEHEYFADLALGYIQNTLSVKERHLVQEFVLNSPEFLEVLKDEIALKNQMKLLKRPIPGTVKHHTFSRISCNFEQKSYKEVLETVLKATLPKMMWPVYQLFQRSVLVNE